MLLETRQFDTASSAAGGEAATPGEIYDATFDSMRLVDNANASRVAMERAYDARIDAIFNATGQRLRNPARTTIDLGNPRAGLDLEPFPDLNAQFQRQLEELAANRPEYRAIIAPERPVSEDAYRLAREADRGFAETWERSRGGAAAWAARLAAGFTGTAVDPINVIGLGAGPFGEAGRGVKGLLWMALKSGAANAGVEAAVQPFSQAWRREAGLPYGMDIAALNIGAAFLFGAGLDAGVRGAVRGVRRLAGRPYLGPDPKADPVAALDDAARNAPEGSPLRKAADGDPQAMKEIAVKTGLDADPAVRGALAEVESESLFRGMKPEAVDDGENLRQLSAALERAQGGGGRLPPGEAVTAPPARPAPDLGDYAPAKLGTTETLDGKPVAFVALDPQRIVTDAATFQFKSEGDASGVTARLRGVTRWDPLSAGKSFVFERANGELVIADGHQRLGLARRLADQKPQLHAYLFREADGWTPADVRALAALKNMRELSGTSIDMAKVMRERPDLVDDSLPLSDGKMREAAMLAKLSPEAFGAVAAGRLPAAYAALIGDHVTDAARHAGLLDELARADMANVTQARFFLAQLMELPTTTETQITLFGEEAVTRTVMVERAKVLDASLRALKGDKRIFGLLEREAGRIAAGGNVLDRQGNAARARDAAGLAELIERLSTTRGIVATLLNDAATAVARGYAPALAARAFTRRIGDLLDAEGINGLLKAADEPPAGGRIDDPNGPEAKAQLDALQARQDADQEVMFALPGFHSPAIRAAEAISQEKGTGEQFWKQITKVPGVKKDELGWMGLEEFLNGKKSITKAEVLDYMRAHQVELDEKILGARYNTLDDARGTLSSTGRDIFDGILKEADNQDLSFGEYLDFIAAQLRQAARSAPNSVVGGDLERVADGLLGGREARAGDVRFSAHRIPGGTRYRELLIRLPELRQAMESQKPKYVSKHFQDQELVHLRVDDRAGPNGEKVLFINEVQSDLHQTGRTKGYKAETDPAERDRLKQEIRDIDHRLTEMKANKPDWTDADRKAYNELGDRQNELRSQAEQILNKAPAAPFKGDLWLELALKRALRYASENGYGAVSWARSDQIAKAVGADPEGLKLQYDQKIGRFLDKYTRKWGGKVEDAPVVGQVKAPRLEAELRAAAADPNAPGIVRALVSRMDAGSDVDRVVASLTSEERAEIRPYLSTEDGISSLYERQVVKETTNQLVRITPEMRASVMAGQPLFAAAQPVLSRSAPSARYAAEALAIRADIDRAMNTMLPPSWRHEVRNTLIYGGRQVEGWSDPYERIVYVSMAATDPLERAFEEAGHALRANLIPEADYAILRAEARRLGAREQFEIDARYGESYGRRWQGAALEDRLEEEAIMQMVATHARGKTFGEPSSAARRVLDRIARFLRGVGELLRGRGFRTYEDVFADMVSGRMARPEPLPEIAAASRVQAMREVLFANRKDEAGDTAAAARYEVYKQPPANPWPDWQVNRAKFEQNPALIFNEHAENFAPTLEAMSQATNLPIADLVSRLAKAGIKPDTPAQRRMYIEMVEVLKAADAADAVAAAAPASGRPAGSGASAAKPKKPAAGAAEPAGGNIRDVINGAAAEGRLPREDAAALLRRLDELERHYRDNPAEAAQALRAEVDAEALRRQRLALLQDQARQRNETFVTQYRDARGQPDPAKATIALVEHNGQTPMPAGFSSVVGRRQAILGMAMAEMEGALYEFRRTWVLGSTRNRARLDNMVREAFGQGTGDPAAAGFARAWAGVAEALRQRFNAAGGAIGRLESWGLPQVHDRLALLNAGVETWIGYITPRLDLAAMRNALTGGPMTAADLRASLEYIWRNITADGWLEREPSMVRFGTGIVANQRGDHRFLQFRNAGAWLEYQAAFGGGADPFAAMMNHIRGMAEDIAAMEILGPNPRGMLTWLQQFTLQQAALRASGQPAHFPAVAEITGRRMAAAGNWLTTKGAEDYARNAVTLTDNMWDIYRGAAGAVVNQRIADTFGTVRSLNVASKLGAAALSAVTDLGFQKMARYFAGLPVTRSWGDMFRAFQIDKRDAVRAGLILDTASNILHQEARWAGAMQGREWANYLADRVIASSGLQAWTQAGKHAFGLAVQGELASRAGEAFADLPQGLRRLFGRYGLTAADWDAMRAMAAGDPDFLTPQMVQASGVDNLAERYLEMILQETEYAVPTGGLKAQALSYGGLRRGVARDEFWRSAGQFKMFGLSVAMLQGQRIAAEMIQNGALRGAGYAAGLLITTTLYGALAIQLKEIAKGRDPREMTDPKFWGQAILQSGGLGIYGDFLFAETNRMGGGLARTLVGPTADVAAGVLALGPGNMAQWVRGEKTNTGREIVRFLGQNTPGGSNWYLRLAYERVLLENLQRLADPEADAAFRRKVQMQKRDYGNAFFWAPGRDAPSRAPELGRAFGGR